MILPGWSRKFRAPFAVGVALLMISCATSVPKVDVDHLDASQGVVFGRMIVEKDGQPFTTDIYRNLISPEVAVHMNPFEGAENLARNEWKPGKWFFRAHLTQGGYFSATLPAGKYYFVEFIFIDVGRDMFALRTYDSNSAARIMRPTVITFEVVPGKTSYVGTLVHKIGSTGVAPGAPYGWSFGILDESKDVTQWFRTQHSGTEAIDTQLAQQSEVSQ